MNNRERAFLLRVEEVMREIGTLSPPNPADIKAIATNLPIATKASKELTCAVSAFRRQEWEWAEDYLRDAEKIVARPHPTT